MDLIGRSVAVVGLGASGVAAVRLALARGAEVVGFDEAAPERLLSRSDLAGLAGLEVRGGALGEDALDGFELVVVSPGVPEKPALQRAEASGAKVVGELEFASYYLDAPLVLIGGTNGKSTTTALVAAILEAAGKQVFLGGNFGTPLADAVGGEYDVLVVEISSFQAERVPTMHACAHALLNVTDDHLDRYPSFEAYARAKGNPFAAMTSDDVAVVPYGDALCEAQARRGGARRVTFAATDSRADVALRGDWLSDRLRGVAVPRSSLRLEGTHNVANACAAIALAGAFDLGDVHATSAVLDKAFRGFVGLGHRCALVEEIAGVRYYDDSKGTNVGASVAALAGLSESRVVLIAGGRDKQGTYAPLVEALRVKGRALVVLGEAAERIAEAASGVLPIERAGTMEEAVELASRLAEPGDAVLLSPACSSFDMFANYRARGDAFVAAVGYLRGAGS
ncbi:MAG: UDP-N-acetylmuramoyl-L-alanine--D-glutamate ligase [Deltaproteobacteria bacterium]|nr:UDP-N-acetylmuramoyl-L-alanine--D-glutamate ligase [Deltaproteobacteria bacterium]